MKCVYRLCLKLYFLAHCLMILSSCGSLLTTNPRDQADKLANHKTFSKQELKTQSFLLTLYRKQYEPGKPLRIYIEGDGKSWISRHQISPDPTPHYPLSLQLALLDPNPNVIYLARPCQYTLHEHDPFCHPKVWTDLRYGEVIIQSMSEAITLIKSEAKSNEIHLIGFSGGAAVATLIAARRNDIASLRTVAGDLDHQEMTAHHRTTPLVGSLNPKDMVPKVLTLPQHHFIGDKDEVVPLFISENFVNAISHHHSHCAKRTVLKNVRHHRGWEDNWPTLLQLELNCK